MIYRFRYSKRDYLDAQVLERVNTRQSMNFFHKMLLVGAGCIVYLNLSALRHSFHYNDAFAYGIAIAVTGCLLLNDSSRFLQELIFPLKIKLGYIPSGLIGPHLFEVADSYLSFQYGGVENRVSYRGINRVDHNDCIVLFYMQNGVVEAVPLRALGLNPMERVAVLKNVEKRMRECKTRGKAVALPLWKSDTGRSFIFSVEESDVLHCNAAHVRLLRRERFHFPIQWLYFLMIILSASGCCAGLSSWSDLPEAFRIFLLIFFVLEIPGCLLAVLYWYRPVTMVNFGMRQSFKLGRYPEGYLGERWVEWDRESLAFRYGMFGVSMKWNAITKIKDDGQYLYVYQGSALILFLPKQKVMEQPEELRVLLEQICIKER